MVKLTINEKKPTESGFSIITLENGKTFEDLKAWPSTDQPPWIVTIEGVHEFSGRTHTYMYNAAKFSDNFQYKGGPIYLPCFRYDRDTGMGKKIGVFGPIEVKQ